MTDSPTTVVCPPSSWTRRIASRIELSDPDRVPRIILAVGPCRSGSTPLVMAVAAAGVESHMQPLKIILRCLSIGSESRWLVPQPPPATLFLKETLGPYLPAEVEFNPLQALLEAGVPRTAIEILIVGREPLSTWSSWSEWWQDRTTLDLFVQSMLATERIHRQASDLGVRSTSFVYETIRDVETAIVGRSLFEALGLPFSPLAVSGWQHMPALGEPGSPIAWPPMPSRFAVPHIHDRVRRAGGLAYFGREAEVAALPADEVRRIGNAGLPELYELWRRRCVQDLDLEAKSSTAVAGGA